MLLVLVIIIVATQHIASPHITSPHSTSHHHTAHRITTQHIAPLHSISHHHTRHIASLLSSLHHYSAHCITTLTYVVMLTCAREDPSNRCSHALRLQKHLADMLIASCHSTAMAMMLCGHGLSAAQSWPWCCLLMAVDLYCHGRGAACGKCSINFCSMYIKSHLSGFKYLSTFFQIFCLVFWTVVAV